MYRKAVFGSSRFGMPRPYGLLLMMAVAGLSQAPADDWPMWRYDSHRSAVADNDLPEELRLVWSRALRPHTTAFHNPRLQFDAGPEPIVVGTRLFVASAVSDRVSAYDTSSGEELWRFYADGPIRLAPASDGQRLFFGSDDGCLYCLDAATGQLKWKVRAAPSHRKVMGNRRLISLWPVRGGPVVHDGTVYFAAGVWPFEGIFVYAVDANTGRRKWLNDSSGQLFQAQPHDTHALSGLTPQGYLLVQGDRLIVPGSAGSPAEFDRHTGKLLTFDLPTKGRLPSGWFVAGDAARRRGLVFDESTARDRHENGWQAPQVGTGKAREIRVGQQTLHFDRPPVEVPGTVHSMIVADQKLFVTNRDGHLYCFGTATKTPRRFELENELPVTPPSPRAKRWKGLLAKLGVDHGVAVMWGAVDSGIAEDLAIPTPLHVIVAGVSADRARALREKWDQARLYGSRIAVLSGDPWEEELPPYVANVLVCQDRSTLARALEPSNLAEMFERLRPYGGTAFLALNEQQHTRLVDTVEAHRAELPGARVEREGEWTLLRRMGALPGSTNYAGTWQSRDARVRFPLGVLWFDDSLTLFKRSPQPWIIDGVMIARDKKWTGWPSGDRPPYALGDPIYSDVYTGRLLNQEEVERFRQHWSPEEEIHRRENQYRPQGEKPWKPETPVVGQRRNPLNGKTEPRTIQRFYGCDGGINYGFLYTMRSGTGAFYDLGMESGTVHIGGIRSGCTNNLIPANGLLNVPMMSAGCTCSYPLLLGLALHPMPESHEQWAVWGGAEQPVEEIVRVGINFGAPGDRMTRGGTLWLDFPNVGGPSPKVAVDVAAEKGPVAYSYRHSLWMRGGNGWPWVAASAVSGASTIRIGNLKPGRYTVRMTFAELDETAAEGTRVFDVSLQGRQFLHDFDIVQDAGGTMLSVVKSVDVDVPGEFLKVSLKAKVGQTLISGIELIRQP